MQKKETIEKKKLISKEFHAKLQELIDSKSSDYYKGNLDRKLEKEKMRLTNNEKREKLKAENEVIRKAEEEKLKILTEEKKSFLDTLFIPITQADPTERVKMVLNIFDTEVIRVEKLMYFRGYILEICPEFYNIARIYDKKVRRIVPFEEQKDALIKEYLKTL